MRPDEPPPEPPADEREGRPPGTPARSTWSDALRDADLLDDVEIEPFGGLDRAELDHALRTLDAELQREASRREAEGRVEQAPVMAQDPLPLADKERTPQEAAAALEQLVPAYLEAETGHRERVERRIRGLAWRLQDWGEIEALADVVEALAAGSGSREDPAAVLARSLLSPPLSRAVARRVGEAAQDEGRRGRAVRAASRLGPLMARTLMEALSEASDRKERRAFMDALSAFGEEVLPVAEEMVLDHRWFVVRNALSVMREAVGPAAVPHFVAALTHADARVRREAILGLAHVGGREAGRLVPSRLADSDAEVRHVAAMAAGALRMTHAVGPLLERLDVEEEQEVQEELLRALGRIGDASAVPAIEKRAAGSLFGRKPPTAVRVAAYVALAAIGTPRALRVLENAAGDRDPAVRASVTDLLEGGAEDGGA